MRRIRLGIVLARARRVAGTLALVAGLVLIVVAPPAVQASPTALPHAAASAGLSAADWSQLTELLAEEGAARDYFGYSVAASGDTVVVGAYGRNSFAGAAYVFARTEAGWKQQGNTLTIPPPGSGPASDQFGWSVAISGDTVVVGAPSSSVGKGAAYVFVRSGATWSQEAVLGVGDGATASDYFGYSVAISGDTVVVGAPYRKSCTGAAYVFERDSGTIPPTWSQEAVLGVGNDAAASDYFGWSVAVSGDTVVVGVPYRSSGTGVAYVFVRSGTTWTRQDKSLTAPGGVAADQFGYSVAISGDTVVVGARWHRMADHRHAGAAYVFVPGATGWEQQAELAASDAAASAEFGSSVAVSGDTIVVGAPGNDAAGPDAGAAYVFQTGATGWEQQGDAPIATGGAPYDQFGRAVAISGDTIVVGAPLAPYDSRTRTPGPGAAYVSQGPGALAPSTADPAPLCERADVAAVIYGAWEGTPVKAWVGGTEQPTLYTAHDAFGRQAVLWTFYPPQSTDWTVRVEPQLPAGCESPRWQYKLVWIEPPPPGFVAGRAAGGAVTISRCSGTVLHFQLIDTGAQ